MATSEVTTVDAGPHRVSRRVTVHAPAAELFAMLADPHRHTEVDGSGTVRDTAVTGPDRLSRGAKFTVPMRMYGLPYKITSTVTGFEDDALVEWQHPGKHKWRWEFADNGDGSTVVTETFDYSTSPAPKLLELLKMPAQNARGITRTLQGLAARYAP